MELQRDAAPGVHRIEDAFTNWYLIEHGERLTIVDAGVPGSWRSLHQVLGRLGRGPDALAALLLTHAHFDHLGFAERVRARYGVPVHVHANDVPLTRHPWRYDHEAARVRYLLTQPRALPMVAAFVRERAWFPPPVAEVRTYAEGDTLPVPGAPRALFTPGHTRGHCSLYLPDRDCVIAGDAVVTLDPYTGRRGPRAVARAATVDAARNLAGLDAIARTGAGTVLVGHGPPWTGGAESIVALARAAGAA
jgi:glyoxylase-like metal-dependent hydrolase (beta-lactamase superfamily II)